MSLGIFPWIVVMELFPIHLKSKNISLCVAFQWIGNFILSVGSDDIFTFAGWGVYDRGIYVMFCCFIAFLIIIALFVASKIPNTHDNVSRNALLLELTPYSYLQRH